MAHRTSLKVRFNEIDPYRHVNHAVYLTYFEVGRTEALEAAGIAIEKIAAEGIQLVITKIDVRFISPALAGDELDIVTFLAQSRRASHIWRQQVIRPGARGSGSDELLVEGDITIAVTDLSGKPTRPPMWLSDAFVNLEPDTAEVTAPPAG